MKTSSSIYRWLSLAAVVCMFSIEGRGQACGFSVNTFFVVADDGKSIHDVKIESISSDSYGQHFREHFKQVSTIYWNQDLEAYVVQHGLCGSHRGVLLRFSAPGFEATDQKVEMPLGFLGFTLNLKRKGDKEKATLSAISCSEEPGRCVMRLAH